MNASCTILPIGKCNKKLPILLAWGYFVLPFVMLIIFPYFSLAQDSTVNSELEHPLFYQAKDSIELDMTKQKAYLYNDAVVKYGNFELKACFIEFDFKTKIVKASLCKDSTNTAIGVPELSDGDVTTKADSLSFNFETKRGITYHVKMQEGEGYIHGNKIKRQPNEEIHIDTALYTTCDLDHPHYYFKLRKAIVKPEDKIISGPVNLYVSDVPTPLGLPFAYFPNRKSGTNGIVIPTYGNSPTMGFFLLDGGYYYKFKQRKDGKWSPFADKLAISLLGDIYSKGSWGVKTIIEYNNRYHFNGAFQASYQVLKEGEKEFPSYKENKAFFIRWRHNQDPKARPNSSFTANVNYGKQNTFRNSLNDFNSQDYLSNNFNSNISWSRRFSGALKSNLNINLRHNQNNDRITFNLPEANYNINRFFIGKLLGKPHIGKSRWYEQIGTTYVLNFKTQTYAPIDSLNNFEREKLYDNFTYGAKHDIRTSSSMRVLNKKLTLTPSYVFTLYNYFEEINTYYNPSSDTTITDTLEQFSMPFTHNFSVGLTTKIYGFYQFAKFLQGKKQSKIRHSITPNLNYTYTPQNPYEITYIADTLGTERHFNRYKTGIFGVPTSRESSVLAFSLINALELKYKDLKNDTSDNAFKKVSILDNFNISANYSLLADSFNLSLISFTGRTKLYKNLTTRFGASLDPYAYENGTRIDTFSRDYNGTWGTFKNGDFALTLNFRSKKQKRGDYQSDRGSQAELDAINANKDNFVDFNLPWSININYKISANRFISPEKDTTVIVQTVGVNGDLKLTENWMLTYSTNYDIVQQKFSFSSIDIRRDLHCWEMAFHWIPFGIMQSYRIQINVKSAMLQDLRLQRRRTWFDTGIR